MYIKRHRIYQCLVDWNIEKDDWLKQKRGISFEDIELKISKRRILAIIKHSNKNRYPRQRIMVVEISDYVYLVPFVVDNNILFLKTIFPNKKYKKKYLLNN